MLVTVNNKLYVLEFKHIWEAVGETKMGGRRAKPVSTLCMLYDGKKGEAIAVGQALLHWKDQYVKATGRKVALRKALLSVKHFDYNFRKEFWRQYLIAYPPKED